MPRNSERNQRLKEERRQQIMSNALKLFTQKGLAATKISDIAFASGISQGLMYHYYQSKEEVYTELIQIAFGKMKEACRWLVAQPISSKEKIKLAIEELLKAIEKNEDAARYHLLIAQATVSETTPSETKDIIKRENTFPYEAIAVIMAEGQKSGEIKMYDPQELAMVFWTSINGLAIYKAVHGDRFKALNPDILTNMFLTD